MVTLSKLNKLLLYCLLGLVGVFMFCGSAFGAIATVNGTPDGWIDVNALVIPRVIVVMPDTGPVGVNVTVIGSSFGGNQGTSTITIGGMPATVYSWDWDFIVCEVPVGLGMGAHPIVVTVNAVNSNNDVTYTVNNTSPPADAGPPYYGSIFYLYPSKGPVGTLVRISGWDFGPDPGVGNRSTLTNNITFTDRTTFALTQLTDADVLSWEDGLIVVRVPAGLTVEEYFVRITTPDWTSNPLIFTVTDPATEGPFITSLNPNSGLIGAAVDVNGNNFEGSQGRVWFTYWASAPITSWAVTGDLVNVNVPGGARTGDVALVTATNWASNRVNFTVTGGPAGGPNITSLSTSEGVVGTSVTVYGSNFGLTQGNSIITFGGVIANVTSWAADQITCTVPSAALAGSVSIVVTVDGVSSNGYLFTVLGPTAGLIPFFDDFEVYTADTTGADPLRQSAGGPWLNFGDCNDQIWLLENPLESHGGMQSMYEGANWDVGVVRAASLKDFTAMNVSTWEAIALWARYVSATGPAGTQATMKIGIRETDGDEWSSNATFTLSTLYTMYTVELAESKFNLDAFVGDGAFTAPLTIDRVVILIDKNTETGYENIFIDDIGLIPPLTGAGSRTYTLRSIANGNVNWIGFSYTGTGFTTTTDLGNDIGDVIPVGSRNLGDAIEIRVWDADLQNPATFQLLWDGAVWNDLGSSTALVVGSMYQVTVPTAADGLTWTLQGGIPLPGSVNFNLRNVANGNKNWLTIPANETAYATTTDMGNAIGNTIPVGSRVLGEAVEVLVWDADLQNPATFQLLWDGAVWNDLGSSTAVLAGDPYIVTVPAAADGNTWP